MSVSTFQVSSIQQIIEIGTALPYYWYRGHAHQYGNLTPKVFRDKYLNEIGDYNEAHFVFRFQLDAPSVYSHCPHKEDHLAWLFLMQHHGCPTRLLDWSHSILVALYFAVSNHQSDDGELWTLNPAALNKNSTGYGVVYVGDCLGTVQQMAEQASTMPSPTVTEPAESAVAIAPPADFPRVVNQFSRFTIHPRPLESKQITDAVEYPYIARYLIPAAAKIRLHDALADLGITEATIFADLDSVARTVEYNILRLDRVEYPDDLPMGDGAA